MTQNPGPRTTAEPNLYLKSGLPEFSWLEG